MAHWNGLEKYYTALLSNSKKAQLLETFIFLSKRQVSDGCRYPERLLNFEKRQVPAGCQNPERLLIFLGMTLKLKHVAVYLITIGSFYYIASVIERKKYI